MADPYHILGLSKTATQAEIKSAYRKLAKKYHPDVNPGRADIEQKFKEATAAYDLLSDKDKRARYDRGELDDQGNERGFYGSGDPFGGRGKHSSYRAGTGAGNGPFGFGGGVNVEDLFADFFGGAKQGRRNPFEDENKTGADVSYTITMPFMDACLGGKKRISLDQVKTIDINVPSGTQDGDKLRLRGMGREGRGGKGAAIITISVAPHPYFKREGTDIHLEVPVSLAEAVQGASITVPTLTGSVSLKLASQANTDTVMRLKGKGVPQADGSAGDMFIKLKIMLPDGDRADLAKALEKWAAKSTENPRKKLGWG